MEGLVKNKDGIKSQAKYSLRFKLICAAHTGPFNEFEGKGDNFKGGSQSHMGEAVYAIPVFVLTPWKPPLSVCRWIRLNSNSHVIKSEPVSLNTHFMFMGGNMQHRGRCISSQGKGLKQHSQIILWRCPLCSTPCQRIQREWALKQNISSCLLPSKMSTWVRVHRAILKNSSSIFDEIKNPSSEVQNCREHTHHLPFDHKWQLFH